MKTSIIILGLVTLSFTNANATTEFDTQILDQQESATLIVSASSHEVTNETDTTIFNPSSVIESKNVKTAEVIMAEDKLITESQVEEFQPLLIDTIIDNKISENNQIIESAVSDEVYPLNFEKINRAVKSVKVYNNAAITVDLKL